MAGYGSFKMDMPKFCDDFDFLEMDDVDIDMLLSSLAPSDLMDITTSLEMEKELGMPADESLPPPETPAHHEKVVCVNVKIEKRFKVKTEKELKQYKDMNQSKSTKSNTRWGMKILQDWHFESYGFPLDMATVSTEELNSKFGKFFCEARPTKQDESEYHKNSMKAIRAAINRHLSDIGRNIDIVKDREFSQCNKLLLELGYSWHGTLRVPFRISQHQLNFILR